MSQDLINDNSSLTKLMLIVVDPVKNEGVGVWLGSHCVPQVGLGGVSLGGVSSEQFI